MNANSSSSSKFANNKERIKALINNKQLVLPKSMPIVPPKCGKLDSFIMKEISENALLGSTCGAIVIGKDEAKRELYFHIIMVYDGAKGVNISGNKYVGLMKDYELVIIGREIIESRLVHIHLYQWIRQDRNWDLHQCLGAQN